MFQRFLFLLVLAGQNWPCSSDQVTRVTKQTQNGTFYIIPKFGASDCFHQWISISGRVIADDGDKTDEVSASNITFLHTYKCHEQMNYSRNCMSEGGKKLGTCVINCTRSDSLHNGEGSPVKQADTYLIALIAAVLILILTLGSGVLIYRFRHKLRRCVNPYAPGHP